MGKSLSLVGHIQTKERLNMRDDTFEWLVFLYTNGSFVLDGNATLSPEDTLLFADASIRSLRDLRQS